MDFKDVFEILSGFANGIHFLAEHHVFTTILVAVATPVGMYAFAFMKNLSDKFAKDHSNRLFNLLKKRKKKRRSKRTSKRT